MTSCDAAEAVNPPSLLYVAVTVSGPPETGTIVAEPAPSTSCPTPQMCPAPTHTVTDPAGFSNSVPDVTETCTARPAATVGVESSCVIVVEVDAYCASS